MRRAISGMAGIMTEASVNPKNNDFPRKSSRAKA